MTFVSAFAPALGSPVPSGARPARPLSPLRSLSAWTCFFAGFFTAFTVSLVGELPVGEFFLLGAAAWAAVCAALHGAWSGPLLRSRTLGRWLIAQFIALGAYVFSDLYRHSAPHDMLRGWSRMVLLAVDLVAIAYLFGRRPGNFLVLLAGTCLGEAAWALWFGPLLGDLWKFGLSTGAVCLTLFVAGQLGRAAAALAAAGLGVLNFALDYRSLGGLCLAVAASTLLHFAARRARLWLAPFILAATAVLVALTGSLAAPEGRRSTRSDIERSAMITAASEAFRESPWIGHGSWFSNTDVYDNFMTIRHAAAVAAHLGGFADANHDPGDTALHSQILVALAEGGVFGGVFFLLYGAGLLREVWRLQFERPWDGVTALYTLLIGVALWNLICSPFSGAHRVHIAAACGLILMLRAPTAEP
jgi:hypothetical protein